MEMRNVKKKNIDRLSALPDSIIYHILSFIDMKQLVQTCILSNKWRNMWKSAQTLNLILPSSRKNQRIQTRESFIRFVYHFLSLRDAIKIHKFTQTCQKYWEKVEEIHLCTWITIALGRNVEELHLYFPINKLPHQLFVSNISVLKLSKHRYSESIYSASRVKCLILDQVGLPEGNSNGELTLNCAALEKLVLDQCTVTGLKVLNIECPILKTLEVNSLVDRGMWALPYCKINICSPHLTTLKLKGNIQDYFLKKLSALVCADLHIQNFGNYSVEELYAQYTVNLGNYSVEKLYAKYTVDFLREIVNVETLRLSHPFLANFSRYPDLMENIPDAFRNLRYLKCAEHCTCVIANFLERLPHIETLVCNRFQYGYCPVRKGEDLGSIFPFHSIFRCLRTIEIQNFEGNGVELKFLESLLKRAVVLKEIIIKTKSHHQYQLTEFHEKLLALPRTSSTASILFKLWS